MKKSKNRLKLGYIKSSYYPDGSKNLTEWRKNATTERFNALMHYIKFKSLNSNQNG